MFEDGVRGERFGNGKYIVKMKIEREIPELIPMFDQKIKIHYSGIKKVCKCCLTYHKDTCQTERTDWAVYVEEFIKDNPRIPTTMIKRKKSGLPPDVLDDSEDQDNEGTGGRDGGAIQSLYGCKETIQSGWKVDDTWNDSPDEEEHQEEVFEEDGDKHVVLAKEVEDEADVEQEMCKEIDRDQYDKIYRSMFDVFSGKMRQEKRIKRLSTKDLEEVREKVKDKLKEILDNQNIKVRD